MAQIEHSFNGTSEVPRTTFSRRKAYKRVWLITISVLVLLALTSGGCSRFRGNNEDVAQTAPQISVAELPQDIGRGYPSVVIGETRAANSDISVGATAPDFALQLDDDRTLRLSDLQGTPVMINFWATWCPPCRAEMPEIVEAAEKDQDLVVIAANVQEEIDVVRSFAEEFGMSMPVALDSDGRLRDLYQVRGMPTSVFIDRSGTIASVWAGLLDAERLEEELTKIR